MKLDDEAGARLRALSEGSPSALDDAAVDRIAIALRANGPRVVRRARRVRQAVRAATALSAIGLAWGATQLMPASEPIAKQPAHEPAIKPAPSAPAPAVVPQLACAQRALPTPQHASSGADGAAQRMELGALGTLVAEAGTSLWLDASDGCHVRVRLLDGQLSMHAADLGGGELRVTTQSGEVVVHGTTFAVAHKNGQLTVDVAEGRVSVERHGRKLVAAIAAGERAHVTADAARVEPLASEEQAKLLARFAPEPTTAADAPPAHPEAPHGSAAPAAPNKRRADALVREADSLWRQGKLDAARARYREAGGLSGPTAEAAWLALARRELSAGHAPAAQAALNGYAARFAHGSLAGEAEGIAFRAALARGDERAARKHAERLTREYRHTAQADAAARWLESHPR